MGITISNHYRKRYRKRVAHSKRIEKFAEEAYLHGEDISQLKDARLRVALEKKNRFYSDDYVYRYYQGYLHIFTSKYLVAVTVYNAQHIK